MAAPLPFTNKEVFSGQGWQCEFCAPRRAMLVFRIKGHGTIELAKIITKKTAAFFDESNLCIFHDWLGLTGYDAGARTLLVDWVRGNLRHFRSVHLLVNTTPIIAMGIAVARMVLRGKLEIHTDRHSFEAALLKESNNIGNH